MKKQLLLLPALWLMAACAGGRNGILLTREPSIKRAIEILEGTREGAPLVKFLHAHPVRLEYSEAPGLCHKFSLRTGRIFLPAGYKSSDKMLALALARAVNVYRLYADAGLDEVVSEEEELSALLVARLALELNLLNEDFNKPGAESFKASFCSYLLNGSGYAMEQARRQALSTDPDCQRPLDTLENQRAWLEKIRKSIDGDTFYQLLYERDQRRVKRGAITMSQAIKNDADARALPSYEISRYQRTFYSRQSDMVGRFERLRARELEEDADWRRARQADLDQTREEFSACRLPQ